MLLKNTLCLGALLSLFACGGGGNGSFTDTGELTMTLRSDKETILPSSYVGVNTALSMTRVYVSVKNSDGTPFLGGKIQYVITGGQNIGVIECDEDKCLGTDKDGNKFNKRFSGIDLDLGIGGNGSIMIVSSPTTGDSTGTGTITLSASVADPSSSYKAASQSISVNVGFGSDMAHGMLFSEHSGIYNSYMQTNTNANLDALLLNEKGYPVNDTNFNNIIVSINPSSSTTGATLYGTDYNSKSVSGQSIKVSTIEGKSPITILSSAKTGAVYLTFEADAYDNNIDNGIQQPIYGYYVVNVVNNLPDPAYGPLTFITTTLDSTAVGVSYNAAILTAGTMTTPTFSRYSGNFPDGMELSPDGYISGAAMARGTYTFKVIAKSNDYGDTDSAIQEFTLFVEGITPDFVTTGMVDGTVGIYYADSIITNGFDSPVITVTGGQLPPGLTMSPSGRITGTPTVAGTYKFVVTAKDSYFTIVSIEYSIVIATP